MLEETYKTPRLVRDLMRVEVTTCTPERSIIDLACQIFHKELEAGVVLDQDGHPLEAFVAYRKAARKRVGGGR